MEKGFCHSLMQVVFWSKQKKRKDWQRESNSSWSLMLEKGGLGGIKQGSELRFSLSWLMWWTTSFNTSLWKQDSLGLSSHTSGQTDPKPLGSATQIYLLHLHICGELVEKSASEINLSMLACWTKVSGLFICRGGPALGKQKESAV